jgi:hypothetical protein
VIVKFGPRAELHLQSQATGCKEVVELFVVSVENGGTCFSAEPSFFAACGEGTRKTPFLGTAWQRLGWLGCVIHVVRTRSSLEKLLGVDADWKSPFVSWWLLRFCLALLSKLILPSICPPPDGSNHNTRGSIDESWEGILALMRGIDTRRLGFVSM